MTTLSVHFGQHVKPEWLNIEIQCLMIQKQFGQQAQVLTIDFMFTSVDLKQRAGPLPINLFPRRLSPRTLCEMLLVRLLQSHVFETVLTYPEFGLFAVLLWVWGKVPRVNFILSDLNFIDVLDFGESLMFLFKCSRGGIHFCIALMKKVGSN